jgi:uncharacterized protein (TIGR02145 family)
MKTKHLFLLPALALFACTGLQAQVTIGGNTAPAPGALLDLNSTGGVRGGLVISNVSIANLNKIPAEFPGIIANDNDGNNPGFKGAIVYNTNPDTGMGIYVWTGTQWIPAGTSILYDAEGNDYTIGNFGAAGTWMTQNLRSTDYTYGSGGTSTPLVKKSTTTGSDIEPRYTYVRVNGDWSSISDTDRDSLFLAHEHYGLLYNWPAASGRTDTNDDSSGTTPGYGTNKPTQGVYYRGVCPVGWHLPSDYEWSELEKEVATNPQKYSSQETAYSDLSDNAFFNTSGWRPGDASNQDKTWWGRQMKSTTKVGTTAPNSSSNSREAGGFDALLMGFVGSSGSINTYGVYAFFWSSSSSSGTNGVCRGLGVNGTGVNRISNSKSNLYSVRCKKD